LLQRTQRANVHPHNDKRSRTVVDVKVAPHT